MRLTVEEIPELLQKPKNHGLLATLSEAVDERTAFLTAGENRYVLETVKKILTPQKYERFKQVYRNHALPLIAKIRSQYRKVLSAQGGGFTADFGENTEARASFDTVRKNLFRGGSDTDFWDVRGIPTILSCPASVLLVARDPEMDNQVAARMYGLSAIYDFDAHEGGLQYLVLRFERETDGAKTVAAAIEDFYVYDETRLRHFEKVKDTFDLVTDVEHGCSAIPATILFENGENPRVQVSPLDDVMADLYELCILTTFYKNYKYFSAFGKEIKAEIRCDYRTEESFCKEGQLLALDGSQTFGKCPKCTKNEGVMGEIVHIPLIQQSDDAFLGNLEKMFKRIDADTAILEFHAGDLEELKSRILQDVLGEGFGQAYRMDAVNKDQVASGFDTQEGRLTHVKKCIEKSWSYLLERAAELHNPSFRSLSFRLGHRFFLKSFEQLTSELKLLKDNGASYAQIQQKEEELVQSEHQRAPRQLTRYQIIKALQPFSGFSQATVFANLQALAQAQPRDVSLYLNFDRLLQRFEAANGRVEEFGIAKDLDARIEDIRAAFYELLTQIISDNGETNPIGWQTSGGQTLGQQQQQGNEEE